jgi:DNA-directed RNA polymerase specialized sigma subunit
MTKEEREQFARDNIKIVDYFLDQYHLIYKEDEIKDLLYIAFTKALNNYDPEKGKFTTFAMEYMRREYFRYLYLEKMPKRDTRNFEFVPLDSTLTAGGDTLVSDVIADPRINLEQDILTQIYIKDTYDNIVEVARYGCYPRVYGSKRVLTKKELMIFECLYVQGLSIPETVKQTGLFKQSVNNINRDIKRKLAAWFRYHINYTRLPEKEAKVIEPDDPFGLFSDEHIDNLGNK